MGSDASLVPELQARLKELLNHGAKELGSTWRVPRCWIQVHGLTDRGGQQRGYNGGKVRVTNVSPDIFRLLQSMRLVARLNVSGRAE